jgi:hypothetical protein
MAKTRSDDDEVPGPEAVLRREAALKKMLATPPQPHAKQKPSPGKRKAKKG